MALDSIPTIIDIIVAIKNGKYKINRKTYNKVIIATEIASVKKLLPKINLYDNIIFYKYILKK